MPYEIDIGMPPAGYALTAAREGEVAQVLQFELLCGTILEAALRTLSKKPMAPIKVDRFNLNQEVTTFRNNFLSAAWRKTCKQVVESWKHLRHRNAHPDWLTTDPDNPWSSARSDALDHIIRLTRFYGYMILALAGWRDLQPIFPPPHANWPPTMTLTRNHAVAESP